MPSGQRYLPKQSFVLSFGVESTTTTCHCIATNVLLGAFYLTAILSEGSWISCATALGKQAIAENIVI